MPRLVRPHLGRGSLSGGQQPELHEGELLLRPFSADDAEWLVSMYDDPDIQLWHLRRFDSTEEAAEWIENGRRAWMAETDAEWLVAATSSGQRLGRVALREIDLSSGVAELSYWLAPNARGRGVATAAVSMVTRWSIGDVGLRRLFIRHSVQNEASCRVASAAGYTYEGTARDCHLLTDGFHDMHVHAFVAADL